MNHIDCLPPEIKALIFSSLNKDDLVHCCGVSSKWNKQASENALWRKFAQAMFKGEIPPEMDAKALLQRCEAQKLRSNDEILECVEFCESNIFGPNSKISLFANSRWKGISYNSN